VTSTERPSLRGPEGETPHVLYERHGHTALITIDRPEVRNCIGPRTHRELKHAWQRFLDEDDAYVGVLTGAGTQAFCAGGDLKAARAGETTLDDADGVLGPSRWTHVHKPTIAAVNGAAYAGGLEWACWTHLAVADAHATFGVTCRRWNIGLADGGTQRLPRILGWRRAMELIVTGRVIDAEEALRVGLVNEVVPSGTCVERALAWAEQIAALPQPAIRTDLEAAEKGWGRIDEGLDIEAAAFMRSIFRPETQEGLRRFAERDHPDLVP
jgi:enoyl-CoA hydratase